MNKLTKLSVILVFSFLLLPRFIISPSLKENESTPSQKTFVSQKSDTTSPLRILAKMPPPSETITGTPWNGDKGITESIEQIMERERENPFIYDGHPREPVIEEEEISHNKSINPNSPHVSQWPPENNDNIKRYTEKATNPQTVGVTFKAIKLSESGFVPPDNMGAAGPTQILVIANGRIKVFDKTGVLGALNTTTDNFFTTIRNGSGTSDPHIRYDRLTQRWFITMINVSTPNRILIAVSSGPTITGTGSFTFFQFQHDLVGTTPNSDTGGFADYDTFGADKFALYIGVNVFNSAHNAILGTTGFIINKSNIISGTLTVTSFRQLTNTSSTGPWSPQGVDSDDPNATEGYFIGVDFLLFSQLDIRRITNPGGVPSISGNIILTVPDTYYPISQPSLGTSTTLDALDDRLFAAQTHINKLNNTKSLWTAHNIRVNSTGVADPFGNRNASRWYEIGTLTTTPSLHQSGTLFDNAASNQRGFWIPSISMSGQGHATLGCSTSGTNFRAEIATSGRLFTDALGITQAYTLAQSTTFAYNVIVTNPQRWGDYTQVNIDPNDDMTMWTVQEYCDSTNSWAERVIQLKAPPPATPSSATSVSSGIASVNSTLTGTIVSGSGFFDPGSDAGGPGFLNHISASVSGGVIVNSVTFNSTSSLTLHLNTVGVPAGFYNVTVTNPDGQFLTGTGILQITPALPVVMSSFTSTVQNRNVQLAWVTQFEINNSGFKIERNNPSVTTWDDVGFVKGYGTTLDPKNYEFTDMKLNTGNYKYRLKQIDFNGNFEYYNLTQTVSVGAPENYNVSEIYPNPSNPVSKIDYQLPGTSKVTIKVFDLTGKEVATLVDAIQQTGYYSVQFDGTNFASGIYFYRIIATSLNLTISRTKKLILIK